MNLELIKRFNGDIEEIKKLIEAERKKLADEQFVKEELSPIVSLNDLLGFIDRIDDLRTIVERINPDLEINYETLVPQMLIFKYGVEHPEFGKETNVRYVQARELLRSIKNSMYDFSTSHKAKLSTETLDELETTISGITFSDQGVYVKDIQDLNKYVALLGPNWTDHEKLHLLTEIIEFNKIDQIRKNNKMLAEREAKLAAETEAKAKQIDELTSRQDIKPKEVLATIERLEQTEDFTRRETFINEVNEELDRLKNKYRQEIRKAESKEERYNLMQENINRYMIGSLSLKEIKSIMYKSEAMAFNIILLENLVEEIREELHMEIDDDSTEAMREMLNSTYTKIEEVYGEIKTSEEKENKEVKPVERESEQKNKILFFPTQEGIPLILKNPIASKMDGLSAIVRGIEKLENVDSFNNLEHIQGTFKRYLQIPVINCALVVEFITDDHILVYDIHSRSNHKTRNGVDTYSVINGSDEYVRKIKPMISDSEGTEFGTAEYRQLTAESKETLDKLKEMVKGKRHE